jgi:hypothetical protein
MNTPKCPLSPEFPQTKSPVLSLSLAWLSIRKLEKWSSTDPSLAGSSSTLNNLHRRDWEKGGKGMMAWLGFVLLGGVAATVIPQWQWPQLLLHCIWYLGPSVRWSGSFLGIIVGWDPSVCLQVQPVTCCGHPLGFLYLIGVYAMNSSKTIGNSPAVLGLRPVILKLNRFICN